MAKKDKTWKVVDGAVVIETPAVDATEVEVPVAQLDRMIERLGMRKARAAAALAQAQERYDSLLAEETSLVAVRAQVGA